MRCCRWSVGGRGVAEGEPVRARSDSGIEVLGMSVVDRRLECVAEGERLVTHSEGECHYG